MIQQSTQKPHDFWSVTQIALASGIAGPMAGCYFLGKNFKKLDFPDHAKKSYFAGIVGTFILLTAVFLAPENVMSNIPHCCIPCAYTSLIASYARSYQKQLIKEKINDGAKRRSYWWCFITIFSFVLMQIPFVYLLGILADTFF